MHSMCPLLFDACFKATILAGALGLNVYQWIYLGLGKRTTENVNDHSNYS